MKGPGTSVHTAFTCRLHHRRKMMTAPYTVSSDTRSMAGADRCEDMILHRSLDDDTLAVVVVDVAGRGPDWRPLAYYVATNMLGLLVLRCQLDRTAGIVDRDYQREFTGTPAQLPVFAALLDPENQRVRYVSAGYEPAVIAGADRTRRWLRATGPAFGVQPRPCHSSTSERFSPGDQLVVVSGGLTDTRSFVVTHAAA